METVGACGRCDDEGQDASKGTAQGMLALICIIIS